MIRLAVLHVSMFMTLYAQMDLRIENSNFTLQESLKQSNKRYMYNYDRLRLQLDASHDGWFGNAMIDGVHLLGGDYIHSDWFDLQTAIKPDTPFAIESAIHRYDDGAYYGKIHRLYGGYETMTQHLSVGIQKISMGVGRIWTPTDLFNPKNSYALEVDEVYGVLAASYSYAFSDLGRISTVVSQRRDHSLKYAASVKTFLNAFDLGFNAIVSNETNMLGYEIEGNVLETGIEWRSEGGWFDNDTLNQSFFQGIAGMDYGFENGLIWVLEGYYSSKIFDETKLLDALESDLVSNRVTSHISMGSTLSYAINLYLDTSLLYIESFDSGRFISPTLSYTFNDNNTFSLGAIISQDAADTYGDSFYFKWFFSY